MLKQYTINKPKYDKRHFIGGKLENECKYIIINDKHLDRSYVSVCIKAGSFDNMKGYDGLAHFLEHMLFLGSKKYPDEAHYSKRLNELGGHSNAYTDTNQTVYYFNVYDSGLEEILDIFSRFFIDPLFDKNSIEREINAVNNEHLKNINSDMWREFQLMLNLSDSNSPTNTFITGSKETLDKPDIREKMIEFYKKHYISGNISICIASSINSTKIKTMLDGTFGHIQKITNNAPKMAKPFYQTNKGKLYHLESIANIYKISYIWEIPDISYDSNLSNDFSLLYSIFNNMSETSFNFLLKNKGLIKGISNEIRNEGIFIINITLTKEGLANLKLIDTILFQYIDQIYDMELNKYASYYKSIGDINFDCMNKSDSEDLCNMLGVNHHYINTVNVFDCMKITKIHSANYYSELYKKYINRNNALRIVMCREYIAGDEHILNYYDAKYTEITDFISNGNDIIEYKQTTDTYNPFLDVKIKLIKHLDVNKIPKLIHTRQWYGGCSKYGEPLLYIYMQLTNDKFFMNPRNYLLSIISCNIFNFLIRAKLDKPFELPYDISFSDNSALQSINIKIRGLNDSSKIKLLLSSLYDFLHNIDKMWICSDNYINNLLISIKESYHNIDFMNPSEYSLYIMRTKLFKNEYIASELLDALKNIDKTSIIEFMKELLDGTALTTFVYGNVIQTDYDNIFSKFQNLYKNKLGDLVGINKLDNMVIPHPNKKEKSNCVYYYYQFGNYTNRKYLIVNLISSMLSNEFFDTLRTKKQLGYLVSMFDVKMSDNLFIIQRIQSDKGVEIVEKEIKEFNNKMVDIIKKGDYDVYIDTLIKQLKEKDNSMDDRIGRYLPEILSRKFVFNRNKKLLKYITSKTKGIKKSDLIDFINNMMGEKNIVKVIVKGN